MAESRLHRLSLILLGVVTVLGAVAFTLTVRSGGEWVAVLLGAVVIAGMHHLSVPTPSGRRINLAIGPAVAAVILLPDIAAVMAAYSAGLIGRVTTETPITWPNPSRCSSSDS